MDFSLSNLLKYFKGDRQIWMIVFILTFVSILAVYSSTGSLAYKYQGGNTEYYLIKHGLIILLGVGVMWVSHLLPFKYYSRISQILLWLSIPLLIYTFFFGTNLNEAKRWIMIPVINMTFQTSDLAKLALVMYLARVLSMKQDKLDDFKEGFLPLIIPIGLVCGAIAPADLSTALVLFLTCFIVLFIGRVSMKFLASTVVLGALLGTLLVMTAFIFPDQFRLGTWQNRIESHFDKTTESYQVQQAKIAIAKGGFFPNGPGTSTQRNSLPHSYSDFVFAIVIEEYGLIGALGLILVYLWLLFRCIKVVMRTPQAFGALLAIGLGFFLIIQALINMAVAVNIVPVTGLTLPLISMGGSSIWFNSLAIGIILSVTVHLEQQREENLKNKLEEDIIIEGNEAIA